MQSNGCVVFLTPADSAGFSTATTGTSRQEVAVGEGVHQTAEMVRDRTPEAAELPRATIEPFHLLTVMERSQQVDEVGIVLVQGTLVRTTWPARPVRSTHGRLDRGAG